MKSGSILPEVDLLEDDDDDEEEGEKEENGAGGDKVVKSHSGENTS